MHRRFLTFVAIVFMLASGGARALDLLTEENPPLNFTLKGKPAGTATAVVVEMAKRAGVAVDIKVLPWAAALERARNGTDACVYSTVQTPERHDAFQWVGPILRSTYSALALRDFPAKFRHVDELKKYRVGVAKDARADYLRERGFQGVATFENDREIPTRLGGIGIQGVDIWVTQSASAKEVAAAAGVYDIKEVFSAILSQDYYLACGRKVPAATVAKLSEALSSMNKDGALRRLGQPAR